MTITLLVRVKGGPGSGNWGHAGRPGLVGGSSRAGGGAYDKLSVSNVKKVLSEAGLPVSKGSSVSRRAASSRAVRTQGFLVEPYRDKVEVKWSAKTRSARLRKDDMLKQAAQAIVKEGSFVASLENVEIPPLPGHQPKTMLRLFVEFGG